MTRQEVIDYAKAEFAEFMQNNDPERCKEFVESRVDNAIRTYKIAEAESVPA